MIIEYDIPDLNDKQNPFVGYWGRQLFIGQLTDNKSVNTLASTYVRLVFSAVDDYKEATAQLRDYFGSNKTINISSYYRCISRFESCVTNMHRAIMAFTRFRRHRELPNSLRDSIKNNKPSFVSDSISDQLRNVRNEIQHIEEALATGDIAEDLPFFISPDGDEIPFDDGANKNQTKKTINRLRFRDKVLPFKDLSFWLNEMIAHTEIIANEMPSHWSSSMQT